MKFHKLADFQKQRIAATLPRLRKGVTVDQVMAQIERAPTEVLARYDGSLSSALLDQASVGSDNVAGTQLPLSRATTPQRAARLHQAVGHDL